MDNRKPFHANAYTTDETGYFGTTMLYTMTDHTVTQYWDRRLRSVKYVSSQ